MSCHASHVHVASLSLSECLRVRVQPLFHRSITVAVARSYTWRCGSKPSTSSFSFITTSQMKISFSLWILATSAYDFFSFLIRLRAFTFSLFKKYYFYVFGCTGSCGKWDL